MDNKFERVEYDGDPERCQSNGGQGQCPFKGKMGANGVRGKNCERHTPGITQTHSISSVDPLRNYRFSAVFQPRIDELSSHEKLKSLREEIALLRMLLETIVNRCKDVFDLTLEADRIAKLVDQLNKLVQSCHKIEESSGQLLDKTVVVNIGTMMVGILEKYVPDKSILDQVGAEIYDAIEKSSRREIEVGSSSQ